MDIVELGFMGEKSTKTKMFFLGLGYGAGAQPSPAQISSYRRPSSQFTWHYLNWRNYMIA